MIDDREPSAMAADFDRDGYVMIPGLLSAAETASYKGLLQDLSGLGDGDFDPARARTRGWALADGIAAQRRFWPLIFHDKLTAIARALIGPTVRYTQHSDLHVHEGTVGWHRDSAHRRFGRGPDWEEGDVPYRIIRVAIYLQGHAESGFALGVIPGSHRRESIATTIELAGWSRIFDALGRRDLLPPLVTAQARWLPTDPGDAILFDPRLLHSGSHVRGPKYAIFLSYGADNRHSQTHRRYYLERADLGYREYEPELAEQLTRAALYL